MKMIPGLPESLFFFQAPVPEARGDVLAVVVEALVGRGAVERPLGRDIGPHLDVVEGLVDLGLHLDAAGIDRPLQLRMRLAQVLPMPSRACRSLPSPSSRKQLTP